MSLEATDLTPDLEILDAFLMSEGVPDSTLTLSELDGFLTGVAVGPELVMPAEWLPLVWGGAEPPFADELEAQKVLGAIMNRYNTILRGLGARVLDPIFLETETGEIIASDWAEGFVMAVSLRYAAWDRLLSSETDGHLLTPLLALCADEDGERLVELPAEIVEELFANADQFVPETVLRIHAFWRNANPRSGMPKTGRNEACPCGSGRKFKKCCGAH
ncbi:UPF0149 family protein [Caulobacter hibisci]|uniref:UPF0149 family protein n=1 Tax=Caulobacter hibisci TaxID=2035993 RepID=A0ABS0T753_9CAUL|nr:UPF0149 family protein [Caulobacter hibisci]